MATLMQASAQWASRPADERFVSLTAMRDHFNVTRERSRAMVIPAKGLMLEPLDSRRVALVRGSDGVFEPTHWSFGQLTQLGKVPGDFLRELGRRGAAELVADNVNFGLRFMRDVEDVGILLHEDIGQGGANVGTLRAATGPNYGRVWNGDIIDALIRHFGDGINGDFRVPGEFGKRVTVTKENTTLFASDRDMFVFLADEERRIEVPNRRRGEAGSLGRGFFVWNSEVGFKRLGLGTFLFDYVCCNRIVWGAEQYAEIEIRHSSGAPERWLKELQPALETYAKSPSTDIVTAVKAAQAAKIEEDVAEFMAKRFGKRAAASMSSVHELEEGRPIETLWDAATAATAYARTIEHQDQRVAVERQAGELMKLAA